MNKLLVHLRTSIMLISLHWTQNNFDPTALCQEVPTQYTWSSNKKHYKNTHKHRYGPKTIHQNEWLNFLKTIQTLV